MAFLVYGPPLIEHVLLKHGFNNATKLGKTFDIENDINKLYEAIMEANNLLQSVTSGHTVVSEIIC